MGKRKFLGYIAVAFFASLITSAVVLYFSPGGVIVKEEKVTIFSTLNESNIEWVYNEVSPSVVHITKTVLERNFFLQIVPREGVGSGVIIDREGYILTNYHVIEDADFLKVTLATGEEIYASIVGADPENDIAVIKINPAGLELKPAKLGDSSELRVGQLALAIGNPFGLDSTATLGIISALNRSILSEKGYVIEGLIQTDASINPGNSGGPLVNMRGEVIGINTAILTPTGGSIGIGFAIPVNKAREIVKKLIAQEEESQAFAGIIGMDLEASYARALGLPVQEGALVIYVIPGSPAYEAGLTGSEDKVLIGNKIYPAGGDIIVAVDGAKVESMMDLSRQIAQHRPGEVVELKFYRGEKLYTTKLKLAARLP